MAYSRPSATNSKLPNCRISPCGSSYSREQGGNDGDFAIRSSGMKITRDYPYLARQMSECGYSGRVAECTRPTPMNWIRERSGDRTRESLLEGRTAR